MKTLLDPAVLFFLLGIFAGGVRSNLEIPPPISRFLSLYLLMALGLKGGFSLAHSGLTSQVLSSLGGAVFLALAVPLIGYLVLKRLMGAFDAVAVAATYGSVSAVTFITTVQYLDGAHIAYGGHMAAALALMESPAIILAVLLAGHLRRIQPQAGHLRQTQPQAGQGQQAGMTVGKVLHESFTDGSQLLLLGSMAVGWLSGETGHVAMQPFSGDLFKGMLSFFLLDMGLMAARNLANLKGRSPWLVSYAFLAPPCHAALGLMVAQILGMGAGDTALLMVLAASASYIAVPAALRYAIPEANPSLYFGMSLGITFPLNILLGIPIYAWIAQWVAGNAG